MKLAEIITITESEHEKELIRLRAARGRPEITKLKKLSKETDKDPNRSAKNYEHGFRSALKRDYKRATKDE